MRYMKNLDKLQYEYAYDKKVELQLGEGFSKKQKKIQEEKKNQNKGFVVNLKKIGENFRVIDVNIPNYREYIQKKFNLY